MTRPEHRLPGDCRLHLDEGRVEAEAVGEHREEPEAVIGRVIRFDGSSHECLIMRLPYMEIMMNYQNMVSSPQAASAYICVKHQLHLLSMA